MPTIDPNLFANAPYIGEDDDQDAEHSFRTGYWKIRLDRPVREDAFFENATVRIGFSLNVLGASVEQVQATGRFRLASLTSSCQDSDDAAQKKFEETKKTFRGGFENIPDGIWRDRVIFMGLMDDGLVAVRDKSGQSADYIVKLQSDDDEYAHYYLPDGTEFFREQVQFITPVFIQPIKRDIVPQAPYGRLGRFFRAFFGRRP